MYFTTTAYRLNVRKGPGTAHAIVASVPFNHLVKATGIPQSGRWLEVETTHRGRDIRGWCSLRFLSATGEVPGAPPANPPAPVNDFPPWLEIAMGELGVKERQGAASNPRILEYFATVKGSPRSDDVAWCSAFVNFCMKSTGVPGTDRGLARSWLKWGTPLAAPRPGAVTVFWRESPNDWRGHVALFVRVEGPNIVVLGGNQGNAVSEKKYAQSRLLGYRWPDLASLALPTS